jgi:alkylated DNA repair dioxygenase AlkB
MPHHILDLPGGHAVLYPSPPLPEDPTDLFIFLERNADWEQRYINFSGNAVPEPRLTAWYSDYSYTYSGIRLEPRPINPLLMALLKSMTYLTGCDFNGVLLNYYADGKSSIGMHADDEPEFGLNPVIASLSLGAERRFDFQRRDKSLPIVSVTLNHGSVLVMAGETQKNWKHGIAKTKEPVGPRINLTFRNIVSPQR